MKHSDYGLAKYFIHCQYHFCFNGIIRVLTSRSICCLKCIVECSRYSKYTRSLFVERSGCSWTDAHLVHTMSMIVPIRILLKSSFNFCLSVSLEPNLCAVDFDDYKIIPHFHSRFAVTIVLSHTNSTLRYAKWYRNTKFLISVISTSVLPLTLISYLNVNGVVSHPVFYCLPSL